MSVTISRARSTVIPLCARASAYAAANFSTRSGSNGDMIDASSRSRPRAEARARTLFSSPSKVRSATPRRSRIAAASRIRSSWLSGSTIRCRSARARSISWYSNISGVRTSEPETSIAAQQRRLIDLFGEHPTRGLDLAARILGDRSAYPHQPLGRGEGAQVGQRDRQVLLHTFGQPADGLGDLVPTGEQDPGQRRERAGLVGEHQARG